MESTDSAHVDASIDENNIPTKSQHELSSKVTLSKRQLKKLKKKEKWLANLPAKRAKERLKVKMKKQEARKNNISLGPSRKQLKNAKMITSKCKLRLILDFSFDNLMEPRDIAKCISQVQRCYCCNRRAPNPVQFYIVGLNGKSREELTKLTGYENWDVNIHTENYLDLFPKEKLVYLTSESNNVIDKLDEDNVYIIGGLVDHNSQKGLCFNIAVKQGIQHGRLPIGEYLDMKSRKVLAINHVFEIIVDVCNGKTWKDAMLAVLPERKGAIPKEDTTEGELRESSKEESVKSVREIAAASYDIQEASPS